MDGHMVSLDFAPDADYSVIDGKKIIQVRALLKEVKPRRAKDGHLWKAMEPNGLLVTCEDGTAYYQGPDKGAWEKV